MGILPLFLVAMVPEHALLAKIDAFLAATQENPTNFGIEAVNDAKLVHELRGGRELRSATRRRVEAYMADVAAKVNEIVAAQPERRAAS